MTAEPATTGPQLHFRKINGVELAAFEWNPELRGRAPTLFLAHATGFHGRVFDQVLARLGPRHVISTECRGHGRSEDVIIDDWTDFELDLAGWIDTFEVEGAIGMGHSAGGHGMVGAAALRPSAFERLLLIDPVIKAPDTYGKRGWNYDSEAGGDHPTAKRKNEFVSPEAMFERFRDRQPYRLFDPLALRDYCDWGLVPSTGGEGYVLACPPRTEASIYMTGGTHPEVHDNVRAVDVPVMILRAKPPSPDRDMMDFSASPTWPGLAGEFSNGREKHLANHTHFVPMEAPGLVAKYLEAFDPEAE
ncbi:MAG: alpha/beta hydrolase [Myxococcota bacterium]|jgi:pimeloyl-ACP methyl ester carboxylesterase|nr:alpha/beta hydrolase [Myxococcota bacterium]